MGVPSARPSSVGSASYHLCPVGAPHSTEKQVLPPRFTEGETESQNIASGHKAKKLGGCYWDSPFVMPRSCVLNVGESARPAEKPDEKSFSSKAPGVSVMFPRL